MSDKSNITPSLSQLVQAGVAQGLESDQILRVIERVIDTRALSAAQRRQFREQVAGLIVRYRHRS